MDRLQILSRVSGEAACGAVAPREWSVLAPTVVRSLFGAGPHPKASAGPAPSSDRCLVRPSLAPAPVTEARRAETSQTARRARARPTEGRGAHKLLVKQCLLTDVEVFLHCSVRTTPVVGGGTVRRALRRVGALRFVGVASCLGVAATLEHGVSRYLLT